MAREIIAKIAGRNIRQMRLKRDWKQKDLSVRLGMTILAIAKIEKGTTDISLSTLEAIAEIYQISAASLLMIEANELFSEASETVMRAGEIIDLQHKLIMLSEQLYEKSASKKDAVKKK